ncbi:hypothetical protein FRC07_014411 [Ceratobasidium sp. 392]|nr:hypothetical protein FRC07_014411 [Ceratobasidium sp. 392]
MTESFWDDLADGTPEARIGQTRDALEFIISHGGATSRWQAIIITTDGYDTQLAAANFLASIPLPELWYLELDFTPSEFDEEYDIALTEATLVKSSPLFQNPPSKLRTITIKGLPNPFLFGHRNQLHLPGLTHLKLDFVGSSPSLLDVSTMLQITSQLTVLHLTFEFTADGVTHGLDSRVPKIRLQHLRELGLLYIKEAFWPLNFVMVLEAPKLDFLQIGVVECEAGSAEFVEYLADGGNKTSPRPVFPSVTHLRAWLGEDDPTALLEALLRAHPRTTRLEVPFIPLDALLVKPFLAPNLQRLRATGLSGPELKKVVDARLNAGLPLKVVEVDPIFGRGIRTTDRKYLSSKVEFHFVESFKDYRVVDDVPSEDENNSWMTRYRGLV